MISILVTIVIPKYPLLLVTRIGLNITLDIPVTIV